MGIDIDSKLIVGCSYQELEPFFEQIIELGETKEHYALSDANEVIEQYFDYASPYYDSPPTEWFIGFEVENYQDADPTFLASIGELAERFLLMTDVVPRLRGGCHVW